MTPKGFYILNSTRKPFSPVVTLAHDWLSISTLREIIEIKDICPRGAFLSISFHSPCFRELLNQGLHFNHNFNDPLVSLCSVHVSELSVEPLERAINRRGFTSSLLSWHNCPKAAMACDCMFSSFTEVCTKSARGKISSDSHNRLFSSV